jgi:hypothetical protein
MKDFDAIKEKLKSMRNTDLHESFLKLADNLVETDSEELLPVLLKIINRYDTVVRSNYGLKSKLNNECYKLDMMNGRIGGRYR